MICTTDQLDELDFAKTGGLLPAIVQHAESGTVLMLGYMNREALAETLLRRRVVFYSRSREELWEKGATSGHTLDLLDVRCDCDRDALLVRALPRGPTCHLGTRSCFGDDAGTAVAFLAELDRIVASRRGAPGETSYTARLFAEGRLRLAQKVGEEGLETALAGACQGPQELLGESADLFFHLLVLLRDCDLDLAALSSELRRRHEARSAAR
jgi:phosphoribosyl-ATP pyrophosphohydrolase/phosphoribosyl-AMP cyclohydrolase